MTDFARVTTAVSNLYNTYPFPPEPLLDEAPPGYNWRWNWIAAHDFCLGRAPRTEKIRILDAGCGTGVGSEYLVHLNPQATVTGIDLSTEALAIARERCQRSGADRATFQHLSLYDADQVPGEFDLINCVGVLHHLPDPIRGIQSLAPKLAPGGLMHIFVYAALGRWEITLMQQAIAQLQGDRRGDYRDGVQVGRQLFATLPQDNRLVQRETERWSLENQRDECFADMYVHPQEVDYTVDTLFELIDASGLEFLGFSNPKYWNLARLIGQAPDLMARTAGWSDRDRYRLIERLDPSLTHFEFFLGKPPLTRSDWRNDDDLRQAHVMRHPCIDGWPGNCVFNYDYEILHLDQPSVSGLEQCPPNLPSPHLNTPTVQTVLDTSNADVSTIRQLLAQGLIVLSPPQ